MDSENHSVSFANLVLKKAEDSSLVKFAVSDDKGMFEFLSLPARRYFVEASMVGFQRFRSAVFLLEEKGEIELGNLEMKPSDKNLKEVNILGTKPLVSVQPDKMVVNVDNNPLMINSNALEVLRKSPGVMVNQDDQIFLQGKNGLLVYIDGRQSPLSEKDLANWLRTIPSGQIEFIEIITNPSAKYDAAGNAGIINIRLKKNQKKGLNGSINSGFSHGLENEHNYGRTNHTLSLNYGKKNINFYSTYGYDYAKSWSFINLDRSQSEQFFVQRTNTFDTRNTHNGKLGLDWNITKRHSLGIMVDGNISTSQSVLYSTNYISELQNRTPFTLLDASNFGDKNTNTGNFNLNHVYKDTSGLEITTDGNLGWYLLGNKTNQPNFYRNISPDQNVVDKSFGLNTPVDISIFTLKSDVEKKKRKSIFGFGGKISNVLTDNEFTLFNREGGQNEKDKNQSSRFTYLERVTAAYASFRHSFSPKLTFQAGLRYEHTHSEGNLKSEIPGNDSLVLRNYENLFPSGGITWNVNKANTLSLNYSRRVDRPVYRFLNPFQYRLDELSYEQGNPFLNPQFTDNFQVSHTLFSMVTSSLGYSLTKNFFARIIDSLGDKSFLTRRNLANVGTYSFNLSSPLPIRNWWNGFVNFTYNRQLYEANFGEGRNLRLKINYFSLYMQHSFSLSKRTNVQVSGSYNSPNVWGGTFRNREFWFVEMGVTQKVFHGKGTLSLTLADIFRSQRWLGRSDFAGVDIVVWGGNDSRLVKAGFSWNFGQSDFKPGKRKISNQEERSRLRGE
jgi:iron complex outermembrane receptor protein